MLKKITILLLLLFILTSCSKEEKVEEIVKQDFNIKTQKLDSFEWKYSIKKIWKIKSSQEIILSSKASGRVSEINVKFWDKVFVWKNLISLSDSVSNYWLSLEKTNLWVESSKLNYESTKISLSKTISDLKINLEKLKKDYDILIKTNSENLANVELNLEQSKISSWVITTSSIQIEKLENTIKKAYFDLENMKNSNLEQIKSFEITSRNDYLALKLLFTDVINFSDSLLWITDLNKRQNDKFEDYLWKKNTTFTKQVEQDLKNLIKFKSDKVDNIKNEEFEINNLEKFFSIADKGYPKIIKFLDDLEKVLDYSIENVNFSRIKIDGYKSQINWYQTNLSGKYNAFLNFKSNTTKFLNTYENNEKSTLEQIKLLKKDLELTIKNLEINSKNAQINFNKIELSNESSMNYLKTAIKNAELNLDNAIKNKNITLKQLNNSIELSKNTQNFAYKKYSKLFINSPISGIVTKVLVDKWQDVGIWATVIKLSWIWKNEIEIFLSFSEKQLIKIWDKVEINYMWEKLKWSISAISKVADQNLNYKVKVSINSKVNILGNIVEVIIPIFLDKQLIYLSDIKVQSDWIWEINVLSPHPNPPLTGEGTEEWTEIKKVLVKFWEFYWDKVEIIWCKYLEKKECDNLEIITNDISNFDSNKFNIVK